MYKQREIYRNQRTRKGAEIGCEVQEINGMKKKETGKTKGGNGMTRDTTYRKIKGRRNKIIGLRNSTLRYHSRLSSSMWPK